MYTNKHIHVTGRVLPEVDKYEIATCAYQDTHIYTQSHTTTYTQTNIYVTGWGLPGRVH